MVVGNAPPSFPYRTSTDDGAQKLANDAHAQSVDASGARRSFHFLVGSLCPFLFALLSGFTLYGGNGEDGAWD